MDASGVVGLEESEGDASEEKSCEVEAWVIEEPLSVEGLLEIMLLGRFVGK